MQAYDLDMNGRLPGPSIPMRAVRIASIAVILAFIAIDFFFFHDLLEPKTLPEYLTGTVSVPVLALSLLLVLGVLRLERFDR